MKTIVRGSFDFNFHRSQSRWPPDGQTSLFIAHCPVQMPRSIKVKLVTSTTCDSKCSTGDLSIMNRGCNKNEVSQLSAWVVAEGWSSCLICESWEAGGFCNFRISIINFKNFWIIINARQMFSDPQVLWAVVLKRGQDENKN